VFDEATSALDSISEQKIQEAIDPIIQSRTSILIAHRLSTILAADEILVVKDGQIVERGQHKELVSRDGVYRELYETQFSKALLPGEEGVSELEQYIWGQQAADEPAE
jgi:ATP-binding cassette subfamily B protein